MLVFYLYYLFYIHLYLHSYSSIRSILFNVRIELPLTLCFYCSFVIRFFTFFSSSYSLCHIIHSLTSYTFRYYFVSILSHLIYTYPYSVLYPLSPYPARNPIYLPFTITISLHPFPPCPYSSFLPHKYVIYWSLSF